MFIYLYLKIGLRRFSSTLSCESPAHKQSIETVASYQKNVKIWNRYNDMPVSLSKMDSNWKHDRDAYSRLGSFLNQRESDELATQLSVFQSALINFATEHGDEIKLNDEFRSKFTQICRLIGIDPIELTLLTKSNKQNFSVALTVRIVEVCQETRDLNGGLISIKELESRLKSNDKLQLSINDSDILKSLELLNAMGKGYELMTINDKKWLKFTSGGAISHDQKRIYETCTIMGGYVTYRLLRDNFGWDDIRCNSVIEEMLMNGFLWVDSQGPRNEVLYWEPSWISS